MSGTIRALACLAFLLLPAAAAAQEKGKKYALLVGVTEYRHSRLGPLKYAENDVEGLYELLRKPLSGYASIRVLTVSRGKKDPKDAPTAENINKALDALLAEKGRKDTILIALAGHGVQLEVKDPDGEKPSKSYGYFCPSDADFEGVSYSTGKAKKLVQMDALFARLGDSGAGTKLILVDACRNELKADSTTRSLATGRLSIPAGVGALFSCKSGERAWETGKLGKGHGVFFHHVLEALRGKAADNKGEVRWSRLVDHVTDSVIEDVPKLIEDGAKQTPHGASNFEGTAPVLATGLSEEEILYQRGRDLFQGRGSQINRAEAMRCFEKAAKQGHALACAYLGYMHHYGHASKVDLEAGREWAVKALNGGLEKRAGRGDPDAITQLGYCYHTGRGVGRDVKEAFALFKKAADLGDLEGTVLVGMAYDNGWNVEKDQAKAVEYLRRAADAGHAPAQDLLGEKYRSGRGVERDDEKGLAYLRAAAEQHYPNAVNTLAALHLQGKLVKKDPKKAVELLGITTKANSREGYHLLGTCYRDGTGVEKDEKKAAELFRRSAEQGHILAAVELGKALAEGRGVEKDEKAALTWFRWASKVSAEAREWVKKLEK